MTKFPVDGTGRLSSEREHPTADLVGPAGGDLTGSFPNPTIALKTPAGDTFGLAVDSTGSLIVQATSFPAIVQADTPVAYYRLDESVGTTATDQQGAHNGTYSGGFTLGAAGATADGDKALAMNGTGLVTVPDNAAFHFSTGDFSLECWVKTTTDAFLLVSNGADEWALYLSSGLPVLKVFPDVITGWYGIADGQWHHVVGVRASGVGYLYVDGVQVATGALTASASPVAPIYLGGYPSAASVTGTLDESAIYGHALSAARVTAHYNAAAVSDAPVSALARPIGSNRVPALYMPLPSGGDDTAALQAVLSALPATGGSVRFQHGAIYQTTASLTLPQFALTNPIRPTFIIEGNGAVIKKTGADTGPIITHTFPANMTDASTMSERKFVIRGLRLDGGSTTGGFVVGLQIAASENSHIEDCVFATCSSGLELTFCLGAQVNNCEAIGCNTYGFVARSATWTGATISNTPSNQTKFQSCRNYGRTGMTAGFYIYGSNGVAIDQSTCEGNNPVHNILFDSGNDGTVKLFSTRGVHFENAPTGANITLKAGGVCIIEAPWVQQASTVMVDGSGCYGGSAFIDIRDLPWVPSGAQFKCNPVAGGEFWRFDFAGTQGGALFDPTDNANWANGTAPLNLYGQRVVSGTTTLAFFDGPGGSWVWELGAALRNMNSANEAASASTGANGAAPGQVKGYLIAYDHTNTAIKIPYYAN